ncbi:hypothetical protein D0962_32495 [Leptolyngbyaceae cyanobacterium CCMR0082]|uniref:Uncharacterized protein n=2 Tax=Adonisia turfae TaxID=2950184 RepID=A0A6M0SG16_9CYAN|nr:hypothetical protein [Adonisia turfae]MDV3348405.1 hypothetical protein [Leptothoe sp. LEGE 181152]NEZ56039.1 hypothetical protein [Adonisia turfae CCMR0081]NEZ67425.1 hypothetical protein [Adonisia turfae CCMR0082]
MWTIFFSAAAILLIAIRVFLTADKQFEVISAGLTATACVMILIGVAPPALQIALLVAIFLIENWVLDHQPKAS